MLGRMLELTDGGRSEGDGREEAVREARGRGFYLYYP